jgi:penicillin-insensitive murein endopeptidase
MAFRIAQALSTIGKLALAGAIGASIMAGDLAAQQKQPSPGSAKAMFGAATLPTQGGPQPFGFYAKGCMAGAEALPTDGPNWQAMRLSRNRRWGNPAMLHGSRAAVARCSQI